MPKVLALFFGADNFAASLAEAAADGAKAVRFTEADVRAGGADGPGEGRHKRVASAHAVSHYDGVVIVAPEGESQAELVTLLDELQREPRAVNVVFGLAGGGPELLDRVARLGGIMVGRQPAAGADAGPADGARALGARVAKVAGWVRHGLGHEAEHSHSHEGASGHAH